MDARTRVNKLIQKHWNQMGFGEFNQLGVMAE